MDTSISSSVVPETVTVRFSPGIGGSGYILMLLMWALSPAVPRIGRLKLIMPAERCVRTTIAPRPRRVSLAIVLLFCSKGSSTDTSKCRGDKDKKTKAGHEYDGEEDGSVGGDDR